MSHNFLKKRYAHIIADDYGFFPNNDMRFETEQPTQKRNWSFFANRSNRTLIHVKFDPTLLEADI